MDYRAGGPKRRVWVDAVAELSRLLLARDVFSFGGP